MANNLSNTLSKFDPQAKDQLQKITRKSQQHDTNHAKRDFFDTLEIIFVWIFLFGFCVVAWRQIFIALGA